MIKIISLYKVIISIFLLKEINPKLMKESINKRRAFKYQIFDIDHNFILSKDVIIATLEYYTAAVHNIYSTG